jgi:hypothetical protein
MKAMIEAGRKGIVILDDQRREQRKKLASDVQQAKLDLHPRTIAHRWSARKREQIVNLADDSRQAVKKNAPLIGLVGAAILLFTARRPIANLFTQLRQKSAAPLKDQR